MLSLCGRAGWIDKERRFVGHYVVFVAYSVLVHHR